MYLEKELQAYKDRIQYSEAFNATVSSVSVGWHIDHILKAIIDPTRFMRKSDPSKFKNAFNLKRIVLFALGFMPKQKFKAPKSVSAQNPYVEAVELQSQMTQAIEIVKEWESFDENSWYIHGAIGPLNVKGNLKLLEIHCKHHLEIIDAIIKS